MHAKGPEEVRGKLEGVGFCLLLYVLRPGSKCPLTTLGTGMVSWYVCL